MNINYQKELDKIIDNLDEKNPPTLLLHSCCGPCSSYVLEYLSQYFKITVFYYNPNIYPSDEYFYRVDEQQKIIDITQAKNPIKMITGMYETDRFYNIAKGLESEPEGGERCHRCYRLRLEEACKIAKEEGFDYFTTTLSISPHKNSQVLNQIGEEISEKYEVKHLPSDFKKKGGYKRSVEITRENGFYRQDYCGCIFSKQESEARKQKRREEIKEQKKELRKKMREISTSLSKEYLHSSEDKILNLFYSRDEYKKASIIFTYIGVYPEINTEKLILKALSDGKKVCVPFCIDDKNMKTYQISSLEELKSGKFGIKEPDISISKEIKKEDINLAIVPCCTCDRNGNRLGFGRGYYDRFLKDFDGNMILLIRNRQIVDKVPIDEFDIRIENIITECDD